MSYAGIQHFAQQCNEDIALNLECPYLSVFPHIHSECLMFTGHHVSEGTEGGVCQQS